VTSYGRSKSASANNLAYTSRWLSAEIVDANRRALGLVVIAEAEAPPLSGALIGFRQVESAHVARERWSYSSLLKNGRDSVER
jgi:hypothetical protein